MQKTFIRQIKKIEQINKKNPSSMQYNVWLKTRKFIICTPHCLSILLRIVIKI